MDDPKNKEDVGAEETGAGFSNLELKPKKKDICIHKKRTTDGDLYVETASAIKEDEIASGSCDLLYKMSNYGNNSSVSVLYSSDGNKVSDEKKPAIKRSISDE